MLALAYSAHPPTHLEPLGFIKPLKPLGFIELRSKKHIILLCYHNNININDMYNNDVGKGRVRVYEAYEVK
jgi:hypothetical protein